MKRFPNKGMVLALVLMLTVVLFLLGISITGLVTMESRSSMRRGQEILTRQTALAGMKYAQNILMGDWNDPRLAAGNRIFRDAFYQENGCYYDVYVKSHTAGECVFVSQAYFKDPAGKNKRLWARGIEAAYSRSAFNYALLGLGNPQKVQTSPGYYLYGYYYPPTYSYVYPKSLVINGSSVDGKLGTLQKMGELEINPSPVTEEVHTQVPAPGVSPAASPVASPVASSGVNPVESPTPEMVDQVEHRPKELELEIMQDANLTINKKPAFVNIVRQKNRIDLPVRVPDPVFPVNNSTLPYSPTSEPAGAPGEYAHLDASTSSAALNVGGGGKYAIKNCTITSNGKGNVLFGTGTYYIENFEAQGNGTVTFTSGTYYIKNLRLNDNTIGNKSNKLKINVALENNKPVNIYVTNEIIVKNAKLNVPDKAEDANPQNFFIFGTSTCKTNEFSFCNGNLVFWNRENEIKLDSTTIDGSVVGNALTVSGNGTFSCHKEIISDQLLLTRWEEL